MKGFPLMPKTPRVWGIDVSTFTIAVAVASPEGLDVTFTIAPAWEQMPFGPFDHAATFRVLSLLDQFHALLEHHALRDETAPDLIVVEEETHPRNPATFRLLAQVVGGVEYTAYLCGIDCVRVNNSTWKHAIQARGEDRTAQKRSVREQLTSLLPKEIDAESLSQDLFDAYGVALWGLTELARRWSRCTCGHLYTHALSTLLCRARHGEPPPRPPVLAREYNLSTTVAKWLTTQTKMIQQQRLAEVPEWLNSTLLTPDQSAWWTTQHTAGNSGDSFPTPAVS